MSFIYKIIETTDKPVDSSDTQNTYTDTQNTYTEEQELSELIIGFAGGPINDCDKNYEQPLTIHQVSPTTFQSGTSYDNLKRMYFRQPTKKNKLILDLDETLVRTIVVTNINKIKKYSTCAGLMFSYVERKSTDPSSEYHVFIFERPYMKKFLTELHKIYDMYLYTNGIHLYAKRVIAMIECNLGFNPFVEYYTRQYVKPVYVKSLKKINGNVDHDNSIIIDDSPEVWPDHQNNLIVISRWIGPQDGNYQLDCELNKLIDVLININHKVIHENMTLVDLIKSHKMPNIIDSSCVTCITG
jgi:TFIIF-interacting CTD phosphatase-like protein